MVLLARQISVPDTQVNTITTCVEHAMLCIATVKMVNRLRRLALKILSRPKGAAVDPHLVPGIQARFFRFLLAA